MNQETMPGESPKTQVCCALLGGESRVISLGSRRRKGDSQRSGCARSGHRSWGWWPHNSQIKSSRHPSSPRERDRAPASPSPEDTTSPRLGRSHSKTFWSHRDQEWYFSEVPNGGCHRVITGRGSVETLYESLF